MSGRVCSVMLALFVFHGFADKGLWARCRRKPSCLDIMDFIFAIVIWSLWSVCQAESDLFTLNSTIEERQMRLNDSFHSWQTLVATKGSAYCYSNTGSLNLEIAYQLTQVWMSLLAFHGSKPFLWKAKLSFVLK